MEQTSELLTHTEALLATQAWAAAALHVRRGAQRVGSRTEALRWCRLIERVPPEERRRGVWPHALLWVAYRTENQVILGAVLAEHPGQYPAFEAFLASLSDQWPQVLNWADRALKSTELDPPSDQMIAQRFRACALAALGESGWQQAFLSAEHEVGGRDRGLLGLEFSYFLIRAGHEAAARDVLAQAVSDLRGDPHLLTLALANLGISCLRLGELTEAERSLRQAVKVGNHPEGRLHLSTAWRGLGGLYLRLGQLARAAHAYEMAQTKAETPDDRSKAMRSAAWAAQQQGRLNDAMILLHEVLQHDRVPGGQLHPAYADLAALRLLAGDLAGADKALALVSMGSLEDRWRAGVVRAGVVRAELRRLELQQVGSRGAAARATLTRSFGR